MNEREHVGLAADAFHTSINRTREVLANSDSASLIPGIRFYDIQLGFWRND
jgi:hypothetical protein